MGGSQGPRLIYRYSKCAYKQAGRLREAGFWYKVTDGGSGYWGLTPMSPREIDLWKYNKSITDILHTVYAEAIQKQLNSASLFLGYISKK